MSTGLQLRQADAMNLSELQTLGQVFTKSGFFADTKDAAQAVVKVMAGMELGFPAIASMTGVYIVKGKVSLSANLMAAAVKRSGKYNYRVHRLDDVECEIEFFERGESIGVSTFSMAEAKAAKLHQDWDKDKKEWKDKATWRNFPRNMLFARAMSNGAKWYCPDIFGGPIYTPEELGAEVDGETGEVVTLEPVADEVSILDGTCAHEDDEPEPEALNWPEPKLREQPVKAVKLEGAQPQADWCGDLPEGLEGAGGHVVELAKKLKWHEGKVTQCIEANFGIIVYPGQLRGYLECATKDELRELYRAMDKRSRTR